MSRAKRHWFLYIGVQHSSIKTAYVISENKERACEKGREFFPHDLFVLEKAVKLAGEPYSGYEGVSE